MKLFYTFLLLLLQLNVLSQEIHSNSQKIRITTHDQSVSKIYISYLKENGHVKLDSATSLKGVFNFRFQFSRPIELHILTRKNNGTTLDTVVQNLFVEPGSIDILLSDQSNQLVFNNEQTIQEISQLNSSKSTLQELKNGFLELLKTLEDTSNKNEKKEWQALEVNNKINDLEKQMDAIDVAFVNSHKTSFACIEILRFKIYSKAGNLSLDSIQLLFNNLSLMVQRSPQGQELEKLITKVRNSEIGKRAPLFEVKDYAGKIIDNKILHESRYVLLDFWASWCVPCREELPSLKQLYRKYKNKGFEIISISTDTDLTAWRNAIKKEAIQIWKHAISNKQLIANYYVPALPMKYLVDKTGKICGSWRGGGHENMQELESFLDTHL
jgi:thiol-disulfide isomerase/thioredoxin